MNKSFLLLFILYSIDLSAQKQNAIWCFGDSAGIDFNNISNPIPFYSVMDGRGSCVSIADSNGKLLFYANTRAGLPSYTTLVWNSQNQLMQNGDSLTGDGWYEELVIVPNPQNNKLFYLFCAGEFPEDPGGLYYSIVDINQNGGIGEVTQKNVMLDSIVQVDGLAAIKHGNGRDWWVINKRSDQPNNTFETYLVTPIGVSGTLIQNIGSSSNNNFWRHRFSPDGNKMMVMDGAGLLVLYDFDRCTGILSSPNIIFNETPYYNFADGEFSPNGDIFYITAIYTGDSGNQSFLYQFDLTATNIASTWDTIASFVTPPVTAGILERGPDGKIYLSCGYESQTALSYPYADSMYNNYNMNLSVINDPDNLGAACNFTPFSFYLGGKRTYYGLPNNPNYELGPLVGSPCDTLNAVQELTNEVVQLTIYPNPANDVLQVMVKGTNNRIKEIVVRDVLGKEMLRKQSENLSAYFNINISSLSAGVYMLEAITEKGEGVTKFVKVVNGN